MNRTLLSLLPFISLVFACSSTSNATGGGGGTSTPAANCQSRCEKKATTCGAQSADASQYCTGLCGKQPTESQMGCVESGDCATLQASATPCGIGQSAGGGDGGGGGSFKKNGEACACPSGSGWQQCSGTSGPCDQGLVCYGVDSATKCGTSCKNGEPCAAGYTCTEQLYQGVSMGKFCAK
jgi:hypothetical protein